MKHWWDYFLLHMATTWALGIYLFLVTLIGQSAIAFVPFFKIQLAILMQLIACVPFYFIFPDLIAKKTRDFLPENKQYYTAFFVTHFPTLVTLMSFLLAYFNLKTTGIQNILLEELDTFASYDGIGSMFIEFFLGSVTLLPAVLIKSLDNVLMYFILYQFSYLAMVVVLERRRLKLVFSKV